LFINLAIGAVKVTYVDSFYGTLNDLMMPSYFANGGSHTGRLDNFDTAVDINDNYAIRMQAFFIAPQTGGYVFRTRSDDHSKLFLSTDSSEEAKVQIVHVSTATGHNDYM